MGVSIRLWLLVGCVRSVVLRIRVVRVSLGR